MIRTIFATLSILNLASAGISQAPFRLRLSTDKLKDIVRLRESQFFDVFRDMNATKKRGDVRKV